MSKSRLPRQNIFAVIAVIILLLTLMVLTGRGRSQITLPEKAILGVFAPVQNLVSSISNSILTKVETLRTYYRLEEENRLLQEELVAQKKLQLQIAELIRENYRLRKLLAFEIKTDFVLLPAEVIARSTDRWFEMVTISKGSLQGVKAGMPVVTSMGLVGSVYTTAFNSAQVLLLTDPRRAVSAMVQRSRDPGVVGVVEGNIEHQGSFIMKNLPADADIKKGDTIISSGLGPLFPKGLLLGTVTEVKDDQFGFLKHAAIEPAVNFYRLEEIFVLLESPPSEKIVPSENLNDGEEMVEDEAVESE